MAGQLPLPTAASGGMGSSPRQLPLGRRPVPILDDIDDQEAFGACGRDPDGSLSAEDFVRAWRAHEDGSRSRAARAETQLQQLGIEPNIAEVRRSISEEAPPPLKKICRGPEAHAYTKFYDEANVAKRASQETGLENLSALMHALIVDNAEVRRERRVAFDLISSMGSNTILLVEMCKHLNPADIVNIYAISKVCHATIDSYLTASIGQWTRYACPDAARIFPYTVYPNMSVPDPMGRVCRVQNGTPVIRQAPSLRWYTMVFLRHRRVRDILACLARNGHRTPSGTHSALLKAWLVLDCATNDGRLKLLHCRALFNDLDIYNIQLFLIKLGMRFNDPVYGPRTQNLPRLVLAQQGGMNLLWRVLRDDTLAGVKEGRVPEALDVQSIVQMKVRYDVQVVDNELFIEMALPMHGVPLEEIGKGHTEGWGAGELHLMRLDELLPIEAARRGLRLDEHLEFMAVWGYRDYRTGQNLVPSPDEMYMSDDELPPTGKGVLEQCGNVPFQPWEWQPWHSLKRRWNDLTDEEKRAVCEVQEDEQLRSQAWNYYSELDSDEDSNSSGKNRKADQDFVERSQRPFKYFDPASIDLTGIGTMNDRLFNPDLRRPPRSWPSGLNTARLASTLPLTREEEALVDQCVEEITRNLHAEDQRTAALSLKGPYNDDSDNDTDGIREWEQVYADVKEEHETAEASGALAPEESVIDGDEDDEQYDGSDEDAEDDEGDAAEEQDADDDDDDGLTECLMDEILDEPDLQHESAMVMEKLEKRLFAIDFRRY